MIILVTALYTYGKKYNFNLFIKHDELFTEPRTKNENDSQKNPVTLHNLKTD